MDNSKNAYYAFNRENSIPLMIYEKAFSEYNVGQSVTLASVVGFVLIGLGMIFFRFVYKSNED